MESTVTIEFQEALHVARSVTYESIGVVPEIQGINGDLWKGISVEVDHEDDAIPCEIIEKARAAVRDLLTLVGVGRGLVVPLGMTRISFLSPSDPAKTKVMIHSNADIVVVRQVVAMPNEDLLRRLHSDQQLRRQSEALNAATTSSDVVSRIIWAYKVLEQEEKRKEKYEIYPAFRYVRNGVAHVELNNCSNKEYFRKHLGADFPDILNPDHLKFLRQESELLLREAIRIVEMRLADQKFWH